MAVSFRAVWVVNLDQPEVQFSRRFPTVEARAGEDAPLPPSDPELAKLLATAISRRENGQLATLNELAVKDPWILLGDTWPVMVDRGSDAGSSTCIVVLPLISGVESISPTELEQQLAGNPVGVMACSFAADLRRFIEASERPDVATFFSLMLPFGTPTGYDIHTLTAMLGGSLVIADKKVPSWRPSVSKAKPTVDILVRETVEAILYDRKGEIPDVFRVSGVVCCKTELDDPTSQLSFAVQSDQPSSYHFHDCVQDVQRDRKQGSRIIDCMPPPQPIELFQYKVTQPPPLPPVRAFYQLKHGGSSVRIRVDMKLADYMENHFDHFNVHMPIYNKGTIVSYVIPKSCVLVGDLELNVAQNSLIWRVGSRFPPKTRQVYLEATLTVDARKVPPVVHDKLCVGNNAYCTISFRSKEASVSQIKVEHRASQAHPHAKHSKLRVTTARELVSGDYQVWNSLKSDRRFCTDPHLLFELLEVNGATDEGEDEQLSELGQGDASLP